MGALRWLKVARGDLADIAAYYAAIDPRLATSLVSRIERGAESLARRDTGRPGRIKGMREKRVAKTPYIIAYRVRGEETVVLRIIHAARNWRKGAWPSD